MGKADNANAVENNHYQSQIIDVSGRTHEAMSCSLQPMRPPVKNSWCRVLVQKTTKTSVGNDWIMVGSKINNVDHAPPY